jgi:hypothetical protein
MPFLLDSSSLSKVSKAGISLVVLMFVLCEKRIVLLTFQALVESPSLIYPSVRLVQSFRPIRALSLESSTNMHIMVKVNFHSVHQFNHVGIIVDDSPCHFAHGMQRLETPDGHFIPISIHNGLPYIDMHPPTDKALEAYPQVNFTSGVP